MSYKKSFLFIIILAILGLLSLPLYQLYKNRSTAKLAKYEQPTPTQTVSWKTYRDQNLGIEFQYPSDLKLSTGSDYAVLVRENNKKYQIYIKAQNIADTLPIKTSEDALTLQDYIQYTTQGQPTLEQPQAMKLGEYTWTNYAVAFAGGKLLIIYNLTLLPDREIINISAIGTDFKPPDGASYKDTVAYQEFQKIIESFRYLK